jgi:hypothetical protein
LKGAITSVSQCAQGGGTEGADDHRLNEELDKESMLFVELYIEDNDLGGMASDRPWMLEVVERQYTGPFLDTDELDDTEECASWLFGAVKAFVGDLADSNGKPSETDPDTFSTPLCSGFAHVVMGIMSKNFDRLIDSMSLRSFSSRYARKFGGSLTDNKYSSTRSNGRSGIRRIESFKVCHN